MTRGSIARRYAKAILALAEEANKVEQFGDELQVFAGVLAHNPQLFEALRNPAYPPEQRKAVLTSVIERMGLDPLIRNFILLVSDRRRIEHLPGMATSYGELADSLSGRVRALVTTADDLKPDQQQVIRDTLSDKIGKKVLLTMERNPEIIGGVIARVGNLMFDYSLRSQLRKVRQELVG